MSLSFRMKSNTVAKCFGVVLFTTTLSGCSSTSFTSILSIQNDTDWSTLYLRGSFTWWEADAKYKVEPINAELYRASVELVADNQPYDFKFADADWTPGTRCGYLDKAKDEIVKEDKIVQANCDTAADNFKFTPSSSGLYHFYFDTSNDVPQVYIKKAQD
ncbi:hypothetical protein [Alteromonas sp. a30]|uniref:hypothetical protein n=1 Tax=Alteromonas sp. a30 TaxID=2730917 RepID=UPI0022805051|nr:hypothetical protein [Alteromonas sp. a30]MCY7295429.1 hypothetical protein [Alteromonas sp. a30]